MGYLDEILALYYLVYILLECLLHKNHILKKYICVLLCFIILGLCGNLFSKIQNISLYWLSLDIFMFIKPFIYILASLTFFKKHYNKKVNLMILHLAKILMILIFIGAIAHIVKYDFNLTLISQNRYQFTTGHCVTISKYLTLFILVILASKSKYKAVYFMMGLFSTLVSTSGAGLMSYFLIFVFCYLYPKLKLKWYHLGIFALLAIIVGWEEISGYLLDSTQPRAIMYMYSFKTAYNCFPFGSGFGTFGGYTAAYNYSILYQLYGFNNVWGLRQFDIGTSHNFLFDTYYPMIIGQFGFFGFAVFLIIVIKIFNRLYKSKNYVTLSFLLSILVICFGFNITEPATCLLFVCGGLIFNEFNYSRRNKVCI